MGVSSCVHAWKEKMCDGSSTRVFNESYVCYTIICRNNNTKKISWCTYASLKLNSLLLLYNGETGRAVRCKTAVNRKSQINAYLKKSGVYSPDFQGKGFFLLKAERAGADHLLRPPAIPPAATGDRLAHIAVPAGLQTDFYSRCHCRPRRVAVHVLDGKADRETGRNKHLLTSYTTKLMPHSAKLMS